MASITKCIYRLNGLRKILKTRSWYFFYPDYNHEKRKKNETSKSTPHCVKSVHIRSFSGPYFLAFGLNTETCGTETYGVFLRIQYKYWKIRTRKTPNTNTFHAVPVKILEGRHLYNQYNHYEKSQKEPKI